MSPAIDVISILKTEERERKRGMLCVLCIAARDINKSVSMAERLCECNKKKKKVRRRKT